MESERILNTNTKYWPTQKNYKLRNEITIKMPDDVDDYDNEMTSFRIR